MKNKTSRKATHMTISQTLMLTFLALLGFLGGTLLVMKGHGIFHEIEYRPEVVLDSILSGYESGKYKLQIGCDTCTGPNQDSALVMEEVSFRRRLIAHLPDSMLEEKLFEHQLFVSIDSFRDGCLLEYKSEDTTRATAPPIVWDYYITNSLKGNGNMPPAHLQGTVKAMSLSYSLNMDFFTAYPGFVLWAMLIVLQCALFLVLPVIVWMVIANYKARLPKIYPGAEHRWLTAKYAFLSLLIIVVFVVSSFFAFFHPNLIRNELFYVRMNLVLGVVSTLAAITGVSCFTGYMLISGTPLTDPDENAVSDDEVHIFNEMNTLFTNLLVVSSIVLCTIVLTTGTLYTSINDMEFIEKIASDFGYSPFSYHYVLLIGILCTVLLLLFFLPAKLRLTDMEKRIRRIAPDDTRIGKQADVLGMIKSILVVGLPIITGIVHFLVNILWK